MMFTWKPIYMELAKKLLEYRDRHHELIKILSDATKQGLHVIKLNDQNPEGHNIPLVDIDPFTFFASFNRGQKDEERKKILQFMKDRFNLNSKIPIDFNGIPTVNPMSSWFFAYAYERGENDVDRLWDMAEAAITQNINEIDSGLVAKCLDVKYSSIRNITMGLFWFRPENYIALDRKNEALLKLYDKALINWPGYNKIDPEVDDWNSYLPLLNNVRSTLGSDYAGISHEAHLIATGEQPPDVLIYFPQKSNGDTKMKKEHPLNTILYGPPGTGKTYSSLSRAVQIIDGGLPNGDFGVIKAKFDELVDKGQIAFITFHQSYSYEDFVRRYQASY